MQCPDCKGTKKYQGLNVVEDCQRCAGEGTVPDAQPLATIGSTRGPSPLVSTASWIRSLQAAVDAMPASVEAMSPKERIKRRLHEDPVLYGAVNSIQVALGRRGDQRQGLLIADALINYEATVLERSKRRQFAEKHGMDVDAMLPAGLLGGDPSYSSLRSDHQQFARSMMGEGKMYERTAYGQLHEVNLSVPARLHPPANVGAPATAVPPKAASAHSTRLAVEQPRPPAA